MQKIQTSKSVIVTKSLLNELQTLAAPSMLGIALEIASHQLGPLYPLGMMLHSYKARFREGAREGDTVQVTCKGASNELPGTEAFDFFFSKSLEQPGRVGKWHLVFSQPINTLPLPYDINQATADGRSDRELWRSEPMLATGETAQDAQSLLWLVGQSSRRYMKRLDEAFVASTVQRTVQDELKARVYGGVAVAVTLIRWPTVGQTLRCALEYHLPLAQQPTQERKIEFHGVMVSEEAGTTHLLGTFRFAVVRLNNQRSPIYANGKEII